MQDYKSKIAELESSNVRIGHDLAEFKAESKGLKNQDLSIKRLEAQLAQMKAQLQSKVPLDLLLATFICATTTQTCICADIAGDVDVKSSPLAFQSPPFDLNACQTSLHTQAKLTHAL